MSSALLNLPSPGEGTYFYELIQKAVFNDQKDGLAYLTAMTKAYFKDHSPDHALKFFEEGVGKLRNNKQEQDDYMVNMFDSLFGLDDQEKGAIDFDTFKQKYLNLIKIRE